MFKVTQNGTNRPDIELSGKLDTEEMKIALNELINKSKDIAKRRNSVNTTGYLKNRDFLYVY